MNCQKCGKELEKGWINSAREVIYTRKLKKMFIESSKIGDISLTTHNMTGPRCEAYVCRDCHCTLRGRGRIIKKKRQFLQET